MHNRACVAGFQSFLGNIGCEYDAVEFLKPVIS